MSGNGKLSNSSKKIGQQDVVGTNGNDIVYLTSTYSGIYHGYDGNDVIYGSDYSITATDTSTTPVQLIYGDGGNDWINAGGGYKDVYVANGGGFDFSYHQADYLDGGSGTDWVSFQPFGNAGGSGLVSYTNKYEYGVYIDLSDDSNNYYFGLNYEWFGGVSSGYAVCTAINFENVWGSNTNDWIIGDAGNNNLCGADGDDLIEGRDGDDEISGGYGNDWLIGGYGSDQLNGGLGEDRFLFNRGESTETFMDVIKDFNHTYDIIQVSNQTYHNHFSNGGDSFLNYDAARVAAVSWFSSGDKGGIFVGGDGINTWVFADDNDSFFSFLGAGDVDLDSLDLVIKLVGTGLGIDSTDFTFSI